MTDLSLTIAAKSDQLNADDLIGRSLTIKVTRVSGNEASAEQPVNIFYEGDNGKPYRPCKSMRRVLVKVWTADGTKYAGRSMTLYRDDNVQFGGLKVGGIRISHMSHIDAPVEMALTARRGDKKAYRVLPLKVEADTGLADARTAIADAPTLDTLKVVWSSKAMAPYREQLRPELDARKAELSFEGPATSQLGELPTLAQALDEIANATRAAQVNELVSAHLQAFGDDDAEELRVAGLARIAEIEADC